jgi:rhomboid protease GluP
MILAMFKRQRTGSIVCPSCGSLVGINDDQCYSCGRRNPGMWGLTPLLRRLGNDLGFAQVVVTGCVGLYLATLMATANPFNVSNPLLFLSPDTQALLRFGASGAYPVFILGHWWTLLSATWLHGGLLHIYFNLMWIRQLAPVVAELYGPGRTVIIYTVAGVCGFFLSSTAGLLLGWLPIPVLRGASVTIGASASIFGLLGALVYYGRRGGSSMIQGEATRYAIILFVMGLILPGVDNYAHAGGFGGGYLMSRWLDPLTRERVDHVVVALVCLILTLLAVVFSIVAGIRG